MPDETASFAGACAAILPRRVRYGRRITPYISPQREKDAQWTRPFSFYIPVGLSGNFCCLFFTKGWLFCLFLFYKLHDKLKVIYGSFRAADTVRVRSTADRNSVLIGRYETVWGKHTTYWRDRFGKKSIGLRVVRGDGNQSALLCVGCTRLGFGQGSDAGF